MFSQSRCPIRALRMNGRRWRANKQMWKGTWRIQQRAFAIRKILKSSPRALRLQKCSETWLEVGTRMEDKNLSSIKKRPDLPCELLWDPTYEEAATLTSNYISDDGKGAIWWWKVWSWSWESWLFTGRQVPAQRLHPRECTSKAETSPHYARPPRNLNIVGCF